MVFTKILNQRHLREFEMKRIYKSILIKLIVIIVIMTFTLMYLLGSNHVNSNELVILTFLINIIYITKKLIIEEKKEYSFKMIFWLFNLMFLSISPMLQYLSNTYVLKNIILKDTSFIYQNIIILIYMITFDFIYKINYNQKNIKRLIVIEKFSIKSYKKTLPILLISLFITFIILGPNAMFSRKFGSSVKLMVMGVDLGTIITEALIYMSCFMVLVNVCSFRENKNLSRITRSIISFIILFLIVFPTAKPRFITGSVYLGIFLFLKKRFKNKNTFTIIFIVSFLLIMPSLSNARMHNSVVETLENFKIANPYEYLIKGDTTSYVMGLSGVQYLESNNFLYGKQMISNILFFIPRSLWPDKLASLGSWLADYSNHTHNNMDSPLFMEFFVDYGYIGLILFTSIMALICSKLDYKYWNICINSDENYFFKYVYPFLVIIFFFLNRGAFMSTFARTVNLIAGFSLVLLVFKSYKIRIK